jgi:PAS domain S-box-containing protein
MTATPLGTGQKGVVISHTNITERKQAEQQAAELAAIVQFSDDAIIGKSLDGIITSWNRGAEKIYGYTESEVVGKPISILLSPGFEEDVPRILGKVKSGEHIEHYETVRRRKDGRDINVSLTISPVRNSEGKIVAASTIGRDITERKRAEEALHGVLRYARSLLEASLDPLVTISPDGKITDVNAATETVTGYERTDLIGTDFCDYFTEPEQAEAGYQAVFREGSVRDYPLRIRHRNGHVTSVLYNASVYRDENGQIAGVFAAARDITERKRLEEERERVEAQLRQA